MKQTIAFIVIVILILLPVESSALSDHIEYNIFLDKDCSAMWKIIQVTDLDSYVDGWEEFEQRLVSIVETAGERVNREMALDYSSLVMKTEVHWETSSKTITYNFRWLNFSVLEHEQINFGDVFDNNFFMSLYGDGELYLTYPEGYRVSSASLSPDERDESTQFLHWYRTQDFLARDQNISLEIDGAGIGSNLNFMLFPLGVLAVGVFSAGTVSFFLFKRRKRNKEIRQKLDSPTYWQTAESDQDKVLQLLQSSGGKLKQSEVSNRLRFSRAKTSLLLTEMERNSLVRRTKKGKNKIIFSTENREGRKL